MIKKILKYIKNKHALNKFYRKCPNTPCFVCKYYINSYNSCALMSKLGIRKQLEKDDLDV
jgi:hypothetical protein